VQLPIENVERALTRDGRATVGDSDSVHDSHIYITEDVILTAGIL
jgi:hypothetical protein